MTSSLIGCHALVWTGTFDAAGIRDAVARTRRAGFDLIEFPLMDPFSFDVNAARTALHDQQLHATASLGLSAATDISGDDEDAAHEGERLLQRALAVVHDLGGTHLCGVLYSAMQKYAAPASPAGVDRSQVILARLAQRAADLGVTVALEVVNRYETNVMNTARAALRYLGGGGLDDVAVHLDSYHMNIEEPDLMQPVLDCADRLGYVHIGESHRGYLGTGNVDFDALFKALARIDYAGPVVFESFSSAVVSPTLTSALGIWRNLWDDSDDLGAHANAYIRGALRAAETIRLH